MTARGIRNNNPGNIRKSKTRWQGMDPAQFDEAFVSFLAPEWGIRAIAKILLHYEDEGLTTVRRMISTWAPPVENNTDAYVDAVAHQVGVDPDREINLHLAHDMFPMLRAIVVHENGSDPYPECTYVKAMQLAGLAVARAA